MRILKEDVVSVFGQKMIVQLVEYDIDVTMTTYPYDYSDGKKITTVTKLRFKDKFVPKEDSE